MIHYMTERDSSTIKSLLLRRAIHEVIINGFTFSVHDLDDKTFHVASGGVSTNIEWDYALEFANVLQEKPIRKRGRK